MRQENGMYARLKVEFKIENSLKAKIPISKWHKIAKIGISKLPKFPF